MKMTGKEKELALAAICSNIKTHGLEIEAVKDQFLIDLHSALSER